jgi:hypothetical protein
MRLSRSGSIAVAAAALAGLGSPAVARADAVTDWNANAAAAIAPTAATSHVSTLSFAMVHGAIYDAVNAIDGSRRPYLVKPAASSGDSKEAAAATAAFRVLAAIFTATAFPTQHAALVSQYATSLAGVPDGTAKTGGIAVGEAAAAAMLAARLSDLLPTPFTFVIGTTPGAWRPSPPNFALEPTPWVGNVKPFLVPNVEMLRTKGPNAVTSRKYAKDYNEVKAIGSLASTTRTAEQTHAAVFWQVNPGALYGAALRGLSQDMKLDIVENARLFAAVNLAAADAAIGCWNDKYYWNFWRPTVAIREGGRDDNPATAGDANWLPLFDPSVGAGLITPAFPDHPSGHSCLSSAILHTVQNFFHTDFLKLTFVSSRFPTAPRTFFRASTVLDEIIDARVWGGIHFRTADEQGATLGAKVAKFEQKHFFQPVGDDDDDGNDEDDD